MRRWLLILFICVLGAFCATLYIVYREPAGKPKITDRIDLGDGRGELVLLSEIYTVENYFQSMEGPYGNHPEIPVVEDVPADETVYLTGVKTEILDADSDEIISPEFFCHSNLTLAANSSSPEKHNSSFESPMHQEWRMFTLIPGKMELQLPEGFGVPIKAGTKIDYFTMALNQNAEQKPGDIRFKTHISWSKDREGIVPLFRRGLVVYQQYRETRSEEERKSFALHVGQLCGANCLDDQRSADPSTFKLGISDHPGATCCVGNASIGGVLDQFGKDNTIHWMVPPGRFTYWTNVSKQLKLPFSTKAHFVTGHLHPYAESMVLREVDTGKELFRIESKDYEGKLGVAAMTEVTSREGVWLDKDGNYELEAVYNNTTDRPVDVMAIMYLYLSEEPGMKPDTAMAD